LEIPIQTDPLKPTHENEFMSTDFILISCLLSIACALLPP